MRRKVLNVAKSGGNVSPYSSKKLTKVTGDFGELLVSFLLLKKYEDKNLTVIRTGAEHLPYDLLIPHGARGTPFEKPAAISVKTRGRWKDKSPWKDRLPWDYKRVKEALSMIGGDYEFWLAFVRYTYSDDGLSFEVYMAKAKDFDEDDFVEFKKKDGVGRQVARDAFMKKAKLVFLSRAAGTKLYTE